MSDERRTTPDSAESRPDGPKDALPEGPAALRYLYVLWKHRLLIGAVSIVPALAIALLLSLWPRRYTATFVYERRLSENQHSVLLQRFYSQENLDKISDGLREQGLQDYADRLDEVRVHQSFEKLIRFEVAPRYPQRLQTTDPTTSAQIGAFEARLLFVKVIGDSEPQVLQAGGVITGNLEEILPIYDVRNDLKESIQQYKTLTAQIEDNRFTQTLELQTEQAKLAKLEGVEAAAKADQGGVILQFSDVKNSSEFLPLSYQILAVRSRIINLQETLAADAEKYQFYTQVLDLNDRLLTRVEESVLTHYTVGQFVAFLREQLEACEEEALRDHLRSTIRKTENLILVNTRAGEKPVVYPVSRHLARNSLLTFVVFLMVGAFAAVLSEYRVRRPSPSARRRPE